MKILLMGDASNCHRTLAEGLRHLNHKVTVVSDGTMWMDTERDIDISRRYPGKLGGLELWLRLQYLAPRHFTGYDVVAIHNPVFLRLIPQRIRPLFRFLKAHNRSIFLTALQTDSPYVRMCTSTPAALRYSEFRIGDSLSPHAILHPEIERQWLGPELSNHCDYIYRNIDGAVSVLYEYHLALQQSLSAEKIAYGAIPIDIQNIRPIEVPERPEKVRFFLGRHRDRMDLKGTDRLEIALKRALERHPGRGELVVVENKPYKEYIELMRSSHVIVDQAYSYTPATNALLAMANGQCTISGAEPEFYEFIGETGHDALRPIYNSPVDVEGMTAMIEDILLHPEQLHFRGRQSRAFVEKHHEATLVAQRFVDFWKNRLNDKYSNYQSNI